jgi:hypothetical protein
MKIARTLLASAVVLLGISASSLAQEPQSWQVNIPFDFTVRHATMEAGRYTVQQQGQTIFLTSRDGRTACVMTIPTYISKPAAHSSLIFNTSNGEYALAQITNEGSNTEMSAVVNKHERKQLEEASNSSQVVEVAALGSR